MVVIAPARTLHALIYAPPPSINRGIRRALMSAATNQLTTPRRTLLPPSHTLHGTAVGGMNTKTRKVLRDHLWLVECDEAVVASAALQLDGLFSDACV